MKKTNVLVTTETEFYAVQKWRTINGFENAETEWPGVQTVISIIKQPHIKFGLSFFDADKPESDYMSFDTFYGTEIKIRAVGTPTYYDNSKGSLYKIATERGWSPYTFDVVKRLDRGGKKDPLRQEIEKSIVVLQLWLKELEQ